MNWFLLTTVLLYIGAGLYESLYLGRHWYGVMYFGWAVSNGAVVLATWKMS